MALRLLEIAVTAEYESRVAELLEAHGSVSTWQLEASDSGAVFHVVVPAEETEPLMDSIETDCAGSPKLHMVLVPVEASVPHVEPPVDPAPSKRVSVGFGTRWRVSREELYEDAADGTAMAPTFFILIALSAVVASVGLLKDSVAVIIGAMVIAPLYGPNAALSVGTSLGDTQLIGKSLRALGVGVGLALVFSVIAGAILSVDPTVPAIAERTVVSHADVVLALCAGAAGALAFTSGRPRALTGVMVAVALLPPVVTCGLLLGGGDGALASRALLLVAVNVICINLAGVATFVAQGVRPRSWWEAKKAKRATVRAAAIWLALLAALVIILAYQ